jgi:hypothetical protein
LQVVKNKWYLRKHLVTAHNAPLKRATKHMSSSVKTATTHPNECFDHDDNREDASDDELVQADSN